MIIDTAIKNPKYNADGTIDLELEHPVHGWIPFTASPNDVEEHGRAIYQACLDGTFGAIAAYIV